MIRVVKKFGIILDKKQKAGIVIMGIMMLIGGILETLGVSMVIPLASAILTEDFMDNKYVTIVADLIHIHDSRQFMLLMIIALILLFVLKNLFLAAEYYYQFCFVSYNKYKMQNKVMRLMIHKPYEYYLDASTGELSRMVGNDVGSSFTLLTNVLGFFTEIIIAIFLIVAIIIVSPMLAMVVGAVMCLVVLIIQKVVKPIMTYAGNTYMASNAMSSKWFLQAIGGIKELKVTGREDYFLKQYAHYGYQTMEAEKKNSIISTMPRLIIETMGIGGMLGAVGIMILMGKDVSSLWIQMAAFAVAAVRLLPSANRMSTYVNMVSYYEPMLDSLMDNMNTIGAMEKKQTENVVSDKKHEAKETSIIEKTEPKSENKTITESVQLLDITYHYPNTKRNVLEQAQMEVPVGKSIGIMGKSGAGKTTAVDILLGLLEPQAGSVLVDGKNIKEDYAGWLSKLSYIPQSIFLLDDTIRANVAFGWSEEDIEEDKIWKAIEEAQLADFIRELPDGLDTTIGERGVRLSGGQRQRIGIARALYGNPELLIFDEATSALDNETEEAIIESINCLHGKKTMIIIAHRLTTIKGCDKIYRVADGKIKETTLK